ncbi:MAG TPA: helix-turn-helix transcriptional regulator [bacterium]|nr:helix-turn-helix transcriptional regulator [bacterium]
MAINKELLKGSTPLLILSVLRDETLHGYEIAKRIKARSSGILESKEGSLYPALHKMESLGYLKAEWQTVNGRDRKYYTITSKGADALHGLVTEWSTFKGAIDGTLAAAQAQ